MSLIKVQHQHTPPPMTSPAPMISSHDGSEVRESGCGLVKRLFVNDEVLAKMVVETPLLLLIGLLMWPVLGDGRFQD